MPQGGVQNPAGGKHLSRCCDSWLSVHQRIADYLAYASAAKFAEGRSASTSQVVKHLAPSAQFAAEACAGKSAILNSSLRLRMATMRAESNQRQKRLHQKAVHWASTRSTRQVHPVCTMSLQEYYQSTSACSGTTEFIDFVAVSAHAPASVPAQLCH